MSSCPLSSVPTSTQTKPHLLNHLSGRDQTQARLKLAKECPQSTKPSNDSLSVSRTELPTKQPPPVPSLSSTKQKRVSRRRATNGWLPVGMPTEREVFIAVGCLREHLCVVKMSKRLESFLTGCSSRRSSLVFQVPRQRKPLRQLSCLPQGQRKLALERKDNCVLTIQLCVTDSFLSL